MKSDPNLTKEKIFKELITEFAKDRAVNSAEYAILLEKGKDLGFDTHAVDLLIQMELADHSGETISDNSESEHEDNTEPGKFIFRSAITRGGRILTPDIIIIDNDSVTYRRRNKYLINVDSVTVPISKISSVELDTSLLGTNIIIKTFGSGEIIAKRFTKSDAGKIRKLIQENQKR